MAVPTPLDPAHPNVFSSRVLPSWRDVHLAETLKHRFGVTVLADNDANLGALAEHWWGAGRDGENLAFIKVATGVGCGLVLGGRLYRGSRFLAGEIGHVPVDPEGPLCSCGRRGCLVTFVGSQALLARAGELAPARRYEDVIAIIEAAHDADVQANRLIGEAAEHLSVAIRNLVNVVNPGTVVLGGSIARAEERRLTPLSSSLLNRQRWTIEARPRLVLSELGESGIALGAATTVLDRALTAPELIAARVAA